MWVGGFGIVVGCVCVLCLCLIVNIVLLLAFGCAVWVDCQLLIWVVKFVLLLVCGLGFGV